MAITCTDLVAPENGVVEFNSSVGDTAVYACNDGYNLNGSYVRICLLTGAWSGNKPICECKINYLHSMVV